MQEIKEWRSKIAVDLLAVGLMNVDLIEGLNSPIRHTELVAGINMDEALALPSSRRLNEYAQHSPMANALMGIETTRGGHTEDTMRLTASFLTQLSQTSPELFAKMSKRYGLNSQEMIRHSIEYMRLHDAATLAFQGAMHGKVVIAGEEYDENVALLAALDEKPGYEAISQLLFDKSTQRYYETQRINKKIIRQLAADALINPLDSQEDGDFSLIQVLKSGKKHAPIDWLAYTARDGAELMRAFGISFDLPFAQRTSQLYKKLQEFSDSLASGTPFEISKKHSMKPTIESLIPSDIIRLVEIDSKPRMIYDAKILSELYVTHMLLRLFFTGSSWIRGTDRLISDAYLNTYGSDMAGLLRQLLKPEKELLATDLKNALPITAVTPQNIRFPRLLPTQLKGWNYSTLQENYPPEKFRVKNIDLTLVKTKKEVITFQHAFPHLMDLAQQIKTQSSFLIKK